MTQAKTLVDQAVGFWGKNIDAFASSIEQRVGIFDDNWSLLNERELPCCGTSSFGELLNVEEKFFTGRLAEKVKKITRCGVHLSQPMPTRSLVVPLRYDLERKRA